MEHDIDTLLGKNVITGDGRQWTLTTITPSAPIDERDSPFLDHGPRGYRTPTMARLRATDGEPTYIDLPLSLVIDALDYGLLEEV